MFNLLFECLMAKIKSLWLRGSSQRLGGAVTYMLKGVQIARELAAKVDNPRTPKQMNQRVKLANVVAFYRANRPWMARLAFESKKQNWSTYNAFVSANFASNSVYLTKQEAAQGCCVVAPYRITEGSMPQIVISLHSAGKWASNLYCGEVNPATATVAEMTAALLANNNGLAEGMQISLIVNYQQQANGIYQNIVRYFEVILDSTDTSTFASHLGDTHVSLVNGSIGFTAGSSDPIMGFAFILSQTRAGRTSVSTQNLVLTSNTTYELFSNDVHAAAAAASYGESAQDPFLAAGYQSESNGNVIVPLSILSVNGKTARDYLGSGTTNLSRFAVSLSATPTEVTQVRIMLGSTWYSSSSQSDNPTFTITDNVVNIDTTKLGSSNENVVDTIEVTADGTALQIKFSLTEEVTE